MESKRTILTGRPPSASVLVRTLIMFTSQNLIWLSTPTAKYRLFALSNCTMPAELVLNPEKVLFTTPSFSSHSARKQSPSVVVPHENNLKSKRKYYNSDKNLNRVKQK